MENISNNLSRFGQPHNDSNERIAIIGLGEIGFSTAEYLTSLGIPIDGYDIKKEVLDEAKSRGLIRDVVHSLSSYDYYIICISTHDLDNMFVPNLNGIYEIAKLISNKGKSDALVCIDSTVDVGTTRAVNNILNHRLHVAHVPHRYFAEQKARHGVNQTRVAGACESCCRERMVNFYQGKLNIPLSIVNPVEMAEASKLVENAYLFVEIAFAEELKILCNNLNLDFELLRAAVNSKWNIKLVEARKGIYGHCVPKDSSMYSAMVKKYVSRDSIVESAKEMDKYYKLLLNDKMTNREKERPCREAAS